MTETLDPAYYAGCNLQLLRAVPPQALRILEVGCGQARLGAALKRDNPARYVTGIEIQLEAAQIAAQHIDQVLVMDLEQEQPEIEQGSQDCILFGDVLEHLVNPGALLERYRSLLSPTGKILCSVPNVQHHSILTALLSGDFQYTHSGILDATHLRFFTHSTLQKLLLDAGFAPRIVDVIQVPAPRGLAEVVNPLVSALGLNLERTLGYLQAYQYIIEGSPLPAIPETPESELLSIVVCVSDEVILTNNLLASPELREHAHDVILLRNCPSAAEGLNLGLEKAEHPLVVFAHQDVYLPKGWSRRLISQYRRAEQLFGPLGIAGVYGVQSRDEGFNRVGKVVDRNHLLDETVPLPAKAHSLDELLLVAPKSTAIRFDAAMGFHFYGADFCLSAASHGLSPVVLDALCFHNSRTTGHNSAFNVSAATFREKWRSQLPLATPCVRFAPAGEMSVW